jgi:hypothetical protein
MSLISISEQEYDSGFIVIVLHFMRTISGVVQLIQSAQYTVYQMLHNIFDCN